MTPVPLDLPLRPPEAAELANLVFSLAERKPLNDDLRARVAARLAPMRFESLRPCPGSLSRDPVHHSTYYMAVDGYMAEDSREAEPLLLHMAPAAAPTSAIFPKPLLIGRMRSARGPEMVLNAIPFGPRDHENIGRFAGQIDAAFAPRAQGTRPAIVAPPIPAAFEGFRAVFKSRRKNLAALGARAGDTDPSDFYYGCIWTAIRTGWREEYGARIVVTDPQNIERCALLSHLAVDVSTLVTAAPTAEERYAKALEAAERAHELMRRARAFRKIARPFDFELCIENATVTTAADDLRFCLEWLKARGHAAQVAAPRLTETTDLASLAEVAAAYQCILSLNSATIDPASAARPTRGRLQYRLADARIVEAAADLLA